MATKYQSEFKEKGFAPEKISNAGVQNILAEGNRQAGVLKEQFAYEKAQRDNVLSAMKSNSAFEKQDRNKNFDAETKNRQQIQNRKKLNFDQQQTNRTNQANAQAAVYKELAGLSKTAGKLYNNLEQDKFDKDYEDQMMKIMMGEIDVVKQAKYQDDEDQLMIASVENDMSANVLGALGAKPLEQQRIRSNSKGREYANNKAQAILTMQAFQPWAENQLKEKFPQVEDPQQKREILLSMLAPYMKETGLYGLKPEFMTAPLMAARKEVSKFFAQEDEAYTKKLQYQATESSQAGFLGDPENMIANAAQFLRDKTVELGGDRGRALDYVFQVAGANMSQEEWEDFGRITFPGKNNPVSIDMEARWKKANLARASARREAYSGSEKDNQIEREAYERRMLPLLEGAADKEIEMILKGYQDLGSNPGKLKSQILENYAGDVSANAVNFKGALEAKIRQAKEGMYSNAELERETDPRFAKNEELKDFAEQNSAWQEAVPVQERAKSLEELVAKQRNRYIAGSSEYNLTQGDLTVVYRLKRDFYQRVRELRNDPDKPRTSAQAAREAGEMLEQKYITQATKRPEDLAPADQIFSNSYSPNISAEQKGPTAVRRFVVESQEKLKDQPSVLTALNTKAGLILSKPRLDAIEENWNKAGFAYPGDIVALSKSLNISPTTIINAQRQAMQMPPLDLNATDALINNVRPEVRQALLQSQSNNQSIRALARTGMPYNGAAVPRNLGPTIESAANRYGIPPAILAGLIQTESNFRSGVGVISSGGAIGIAQIVPKWHPTIKPGLSDVDDINYAASYLGWLRDKFGGDLERAIYAYNAGPEGGVGLSRENREYLPKVLENAARYGYNETWKQPQSMRPGMAPKVMYVAGNIGSGAAYTGEHTDVKRTDGQKFSPTDLDQYVEVEDSEKGRVPLSQVGVTGDWKSHTDRDSHGIDFGTISGDKLYVKNGAEIVYENDSGDGNGDVVAIRTPDGIEYQFLHGRMAP